MKITVLTLFPDMVQSFLKESIVKRAQDKKLVEIDIVNLRDFSTDKYKTVDDRPYGGSAGMILMAKPIVDAIKKFSIFNFQFSEKSSKKQKIILTSPRGKIYKQNNALEYSKLDHLIIIAGHYEGVDERITNYIDEEISLGDFVMTGGEITTAAIVDSIVRLLPGVLKKDDAIQEESFFTVPIGELLSIVGELELLLQLAKKGATHVTLLEYPHYTRPEDYEGQKVPDVLISGNHAEIKKWRIKKAFEITLARRKDLLEAEGDF